MQCFWITRRVYDETKKHSQVVWGFQRYQITEEYVCRSVIITPLSLLLDVCTFFRCRYVGAALFVQTKPIPSSSLCKLTCVDAFYIQYNFYFIRTWFIRTSRLRFDWKLRIRKNIVMLRLRKIRTFDIYLFVWKFTGCIFSCVIQRYIYVTIIRPNSQNYLLIVWNHITS